jgi:hypothetical protein
MLELAPRLVKAAFSLFIHVTHPLRAFVPTVTLVPLADVTLEELRSAVNASDVALRAKLNVGGTTAVIMI